MSYAIDRIADQRVADVVEVSFFLDVQHFEIGNRGVQDWIPVDQSRTSINQTFFVELDENFLHGSGQTVVHSEALARPVGRCAHTP